MLHQECESLSGFEMSGWFFSASAGIGDSEAEGSGYGVGLVSILQHQPPVLGQCQVVTSGQVAQSERLAPADVAPTPAVKNRPSGLPPTDSSYARPLALNVDLSEDLLANDDDLKLE
ncbi:hypothetical protein INR49_030849, partial [Caranx melampygus]